MDPSKQVAMCAYLSHYSEGDFNLFKRGMAEAECTYSERFDSKFLPYNLFQAYVSAGLIEVTESNPLLRWHCYLPGNIEVRGSPHKRILVRNIESDVVTLIQTKNGMPLLFGSAEVDPSSSNVFSYQPSVLQKIGSFSSIVDRISIKVRWDISDSSEMERYTVTSGWTPFEMSSLDSPSFVRIRGSWGGRQYFVVFPEIDYALKIDAVEWAYLAAARLLRWDLSEIIKFQQKTVMVPGSFRLPTLVLRVLFSKASMVILGDVNSWENFEPANAESLRSYFEIEVANEKSS